MGWSLRRIRPGLLAIVAMQHALAMDARAQAAGQEEPSQTSDTPGAATHDPATGGRDDADASSTWDDGASGGAAASQAASDDWEDEDDGDFEDEPALSVNGMLRMQGGVFAPMISSNFKPEHNEAYRVVDLGRYGAPCDPLKMPYYPCAPVDHGQPPGSLSIARATLQLEGHWQATERISLHAIVRGVRSLSLAADRYAQIPQPRSDPDERGSYAREWAAENYYNEFDLRELYLDLDPTDWLNIRIGRQQIAWGETSSFRLLDVVNPTNATWHFGPLENMEDIRVPLWMIDTGIDVPALDGTLELLWVPLIDRPKDTVTTPLTFVGAWGVPYSNQPPAFYVENKDFLYPGRKLSDSRGGARWKGNLGNKASYCLVYYYTHQINMPVPTHFYARPKLDEDGQPSADWPDGLDRNIQSISRYVLEFPRQHVAGATFEYAFDSPIGTLLRLEGAVVPDRTFPSRTDSSFSADPRDPLRSNYHPRKLLSASYAVSLQRSTMLRFLNPTQSFLLFAQFSHTVVPGLDVEGRDAQLVEVPIYNKWQAQKHSFNLVFMARTTYLNGKVTPRLTVAYLPNLYAGDSGFYSLDVDFRLSTHYALNLRLTDFFGKDPYRELGLYRDRDEAHAMLTIQF
ncbi:MAG: hypothetical protein QM778_19320 [Myxococcales bacterium]